MARSFRSPTDFAASRGRTLETKETSMIKAQLVPLSIARGAPRVFTIEITGIDLTGADLHAMIRLTRDAPGAPLLDLPPTTDAGAPGVRLVGTDDSGLLPVSWVRLQIPAMSDGYGQNQLPPADDPGDDVALSWDLFVTPQGWTTDRWLYGPVTVEGTATKFNPLPSLANDPLPGVDAAAKLVGFNLSITLAGASLILPLLERADGSAAQAVAAAAQATAKAQQAVDAAHEAEQQVDLALPKSGGQMSGILGMGGHRIEAVGDPDTDDDAVNWGWLKNALNSLALTIASALTGKLSVTGGSLTGLLNMGGNRIEAVGYPDSDDDAAHAGYVKEKVSGLSADVGTAVALLASKSGVPNIQANAIGNSLDGPNTANAGSLWIVGNASLVADGALTSLSAKTAKAGSGAFVFGTVSGGNFTPQAVYNASFTAGAVTRLTPGNGFPLATTVKAGWMLAFWSPAAGGAQLAYDTGGSNFGATNVSGVAIGSAMPVTAGIAKLSLQAEYSIAANALDPRLLAVEAAIPVLTATTGASASQIGSVADKVGTSTYQAATLGNALDGTSSATAGKLWAVNGAAFPVDAPLNSLSVKTGTAGTGALVLGTYDGTSFNPQAIYPATFTAGGVTTLTPGNGLPLGARVKAGWMIAFWSPASGGANLSYGLNGSHLSGDASGITAGTPIAVTASNAKLSIQASYGVATNAIEPRVAAVEAVMPSLSASAAQAGSVADKVGTSTYQPVTLGNTLDGSQSATAGTLWAVNGVSFPVDAPLNSLSVKTGTAGTGALVLGTYDGTSFNPQAIYPASFNVGAVTTLTPGNGLPIGTRVKAGWMIAFWSPLAGGAKLSYDAGGSHLSGQAQTSITAGTPVAVTASGAKLSIQASYGVATNAIEPRFAAAEGAVASLGAGIAASFPKSDQPACINTQTATYTGPSNNFTSWSFRIDAGDQIPAGTPISALRIPMQPQAAGQNFRLRLYVGSQTDPNAANPVPIAGETLVATVLVSVASTGIAPNAFGNVTFAFPAVTLVAGQSFGVILDILDGNGVQTQIGVGRGAVLSPARRRGWYGSNGSTTTAPNGSGSVAFTAVTTRYSVQTSVASVRDLVSALATSVSGLAVTVSGGTLMRGNDTVPFGGTVALGAAPTGSTTDTSVNWTGAALMLGYGGLNSNAMAYVPKTGWLPRAHVSGLVVKRASDGAVLTLNTDYIANTEHGGISLSASGTAYAVTASYTWAQVRYDLIYLDQETMAIGAVVGTPRDRDVAEYLPKASVGQLPLAYARVVGGTITTVIPVYDVEGGIRRKYVGDLAERRRLNRIRLRKTLGRANAGQTFPFVSYSDSIEAMQAGVPPYATPNGVLRDRGTTGFLADAQSPDTLATVPTYTAVQLGMADDGAGQVHTKLGKSWGFIAGLLDRHPDCTIQYKNLSIASTTAETTDQGNGVLNGGNPTRLSVAVAAASGGTAHVCFGQNGMSNAPTATRAQMVAIIQAFQAGPGNGLPGADVIVSGVTRPNAYGGRTLQMWLDTNRAVEAAADFCGAAFVPTRLVADDDNIGVLGLDLLDMSAANLTNHPGIREQTAYGEIMRAAIL
jgi:hypothetical protein